MIQQGRLGAASGESFMTSVAASDLSWTRDRVHVFCLPVPEEFAEAVWEDAFVRAALTPGERKKYASYRIRSRRNELLLSRVLLRAICRRLGLKGPSLRYDTLGKPEVVGAADPAIHLNPSDTEGMLMWALSPAGPLGCDVERVTREDDEVAAAHFEPRELQEYLSLEGEARRDRFFRLWTLKEALIKADGRGLGVPLDSFRFRFPAGSGQPELEVLRRADGPASGAWVCAAVECGSDFRAAVAVRAAGPVRVVAHRIVLEGWPAGRQGRWRFAEVPAGGSAERSVPFANLGPDDLAPLDDTA